MMFARENFFHRLVFFMENLDIRHMANDDPRGFFNDHGENLILDEIQRVPALFSYLQEKADIAKSSASYILTGSQQFLLMEKITQSLAGRIINFQLYPFTFNELHGLKRDKDIDSIFKTKTKYTKPVEDIDIYLTNGNPSSIHSFMPTDRL